MRSQWPSLDRSQSRGSTKAADTAGRTARQPAPLLWGGADRLWALPPSHRTRSRM